MKRTIKIIMIIFTVLLTFGSCVILPKGYSSGYINEERELKKIAKTILKSLDEDDFDTLKSLFCEYNSSQPGFDEQLRDAMDFFEGKTISNHSDERVFGGGGGTIWRKGQITQMHSSGKINNIETDAGKRYSISFHNYLISAVEPDKEGIYTLRITPIGNDDPESWQIIDTLKTELVFNGKDEMYPYTLVIRNWTEDDFSAWKVSFDFTGVIERISGDDLIVSDHPSYVVRSEATNTAPLWAGGKKWILIVCPADDSYEISNVVVYVLKEKMRSVGEYVLAATDWPEE